VENHPVQDWGPSKHHRGSNLCASRNGLVPGDSDEFFQKLARAVPKDLKSFDKIAFAME
jgi:hypothetical protein